MNRNAIFLIVIWVVFGGTGCALQSRGVNEPTAIGPGAAQFDAAPLVSSWVDMWNQYDLALVEKLFLRSDDLTYFSSEKQGLIKGFDAVIAHHKGFGFVPGGKPADTKLWVEDLHATVFDTSVVVSGVWFFQNADNKLQRGPVTFVYVVKNGERRLAHLHFANYDPALPADAEAISLLGKVLYTPPMKDEVRADFEQKLAQSRADFEADATDPVRLIWYGRRTAYLGQYRRSIEIFTEGIKSFPEDARMLRHRGHRYITLRQFQKAIDDLTLASRLIRGKADVVEPDGMPNEKNIPLSTLNTNIGYHLGLAHYLNGDFKAAKSAYETCLAASTNDDMRVATAHWLYMTLRRLGEDEAAAKLLVPIREEMEIIENRGYHQLLLFYKGEITVEALVDGSYNWLDNPAVMYGVGNWYLYNGKHEQAVAAFEKVIAGSHWSAFGHIAAEVALSRL